MSTLGEKRVRIDFNVTKNSLVDKIKSNSAELINLINTSSIRENATQEEIQEWYRLKALAMTAVEEAAMWGVKAATI